MLKKEKQQNLCSTVVVYKQDNSSPGKSMVDSSGGGGRHKKCKMHFLAFRTRCELGRRSRCALFTFTTRSLCCKAANLKRNQLQFRSIGEKKSKGKQGRECECECECSNTTWPASKPRKNGEKIIHRCTSW